MNFRDLPAKSASNPSIGAAFGAELVDGRTSDKAADDVAEVETELASELGADESDEIDAKLGATTCEA